MPSARGRRSAGIARYYQLYTALSDNLHRGAIAPGEALPSEPELTRRYGVSRTTVRRALRELEREGRIVRRRGSGTYAPELSKIERKPPISLGARLDPDCSLEHSALRLLSFERRATPAWLSRLCPRFGERVLRIARVQAQRGRPFVRITSYVPGRLGDRISGKTLGDRPITAVLDDLGAIGQLAEQTIVATIADGPLARCLSVLLGSPVLEVRRLVRDAAGHPIEYRCCQYRADRYQQHLLLRRAQAPGRDSHWSPVAN